MVFARGTEGDPGREEGRACNSLDKGEGLIEGND